MSKDEKSDSKADPKAAPDLGLLEEDDEFQEFPAEDWSGKDEDSDDVNVWEDNWDDDNVEDDFSVQLRRYSRKRSYPHSPPLRSPSPVAKKRCSRTSPVVAPATPTGNGHAHQTAESNEDGSGARPLTAQRPGGGGAGPLDPVLGIRTPIPLPPAH